MSNLRIWKWPLEITDRQTIMAPKHARLLTIQMQGDQPCLWALCSIDADYEPRTIHIYGTGNPVFEESGSYIATFQSDGGLFGTRSRLRHETRHEAHHKVR